jgi:hypothetical protein
MGKYWQPAIPSGGPGGYTFGNDLIPKEKCRLKINIRNVNNDDDKIEESSPLIKVSLC